MSKEKRKRFVADFETTKGEGNTHIWAYGITEVGNTNFFTWGKTLDQFFAFCEKGNPIVYFHNLKFDGEFLFHYLLTHGYSYNKEKKDKTFTTIISDMGQFYAIEVIFEKMNKSYKKVTIYDSLKKLPFSAKKIAKDFKLPIQKLEIDHNIYRPIGYEPSLEEIHYLRNDVEIIARALKIQYDSGLIKMTNGSDAMYDFKKIVGKKDYERTYPVLDTVVDSDIREAYRGGFTYLNKKYAEKDVGSGVVLDVNSLYPYVMYSKPLPYGTPIFFHGEYEQDDMYPFYIQAFWCEFKLKKDKIPSIQVKGTLQFVPTEYIEDSGDDPVWLCLTNIDLDLFFEHYDVHILEWCEGWKFKAYQGMFTSYIEKWTKVKEDNAQERNALYTLAKLMLNSLYGKFASRPDLKGKYPFLDPDTNTVRYGRTDVVHKDPIYTALSCFVTSWARDLTIRSAQKEYHRFIYADTDSLHLEGTTIPDSLEIHNSKMGAWKVEGTFDRGRFIRAKTYIEEFEGVLSVTCAGMPDNVKTLVTWENFRKENSNMLMPCRDGSYYGKLMPKRVDGGVILTDSIFTIR